jgi:hypothetical protein
MGVDTVNLHRLTWSGIPGGVTPPQSNAGESKSTAPSHQGLTRVHFSAQPQPLMTQNTPFTLYYPLIPPKHRLNNPLLHPLSNSKRLC